MVNSVKFMFLAILLTVSAGLFAQRAGDSLSAVSSVCEIARTGFMLPVIAGKAGTSGFTNSKFQKNKNYDKNPEKTKSCIENLILYIIYDDCTTNNFPDSQDS